MVDVVEQRAVPVGAGSLAGGDELLQRVWGPDYSGENTYLRTFVRHLRRKLEPNPAQPRFLLNELGVGYYVPLPDSDASFGLHSPEPGVER